MKVQIDNLGKVSVTVEKDAWDFNKAYDRLTIVQVEDKFGTYISRKDVPAHIYTTNREYWIPFSSLKEDIILDYNSFKEKYGTELANIKENLKTTTSSIETLINLKSEIVKATEAATLAKQKAEQAATNAAQATSSAKETVTKSNQILNTLKTEQNQINEIKESNKTIENNVTKLYEQQNNIDKKIKSNTELIKDNTSNIDTNKTNINKLSNKITTVNNELVTFKNTKGKPCGLAVLDCTGKIPLKYVPSLDSDNENSILNPTNPNSPLNPDNENSPLNPSNPDSLLNPDNPDSLLNKDNPNSPLNPSNPDSPLNPDNLGDNIIGSVTGPNGEVFSKILYVDCKENLPYEGEPDTLYIVGVDRRIYYYGKKIIKATDLIRHEEYDEEGNYLGGNIIDEFGFSYCNNGYIGKLVIDKDGNYIKEDFPFDYNNWMPYYDNYYMVLVNPIIDEEGNYILDEEGFGIYEEPKYWQELTKQYQINYLQNSRTVVELEPIDGYLQLKTFDIVPIIIDPETNNYLDVNGNAIINYYEEWIDPETNINYLIIRSNISRIDYDINFPYKDEIIGNIWISDYDINSSGVIYNYINLDIAVQFKKLVIFGSDYNDIAIKIKLYKKGEVSELIYDKTLGRNELNVDNLYLESNCIHTFNIGKQLNDLTTNISAIEFIEASIELYVNNVLINTDSKVLLTNTHRATDTIRFFKTDADGSFDENNYVVDRIDTHKDLKHSYLGIEYINTVINEEGSIDMNVEIEINFETNDHDDTGGFTINIPEDVENFEYATITVVNNVIRIAIDIFSIMSIRKDTIFNISVYHNRGSIKEYIKTNYIYLHFNNYVYATGFYIHQLDRHNGFNKLDISPQLYIDENGDIYETKYNTASEAYTIFNNINKEDPENKINLNCIAHLRQCVRMFKYDNYSTVAEKDNKRISFSNGDPAVVACVKDFYYTIINCKDTDNLLVVFSLYEIPTILGETVNWEFVSKYKYYNMGKITTLSSSCIGDAPNLYTPNYSAVSPDIEATNYVSYKDRCMLALLFYGFYGDFTGSPIGIPEDCFINTENEVTFYPKKVGNNIMTGFNNTINDTTPFEHEELTDEQISQAIGKTVQFWGLDDLFGTTPELVRGLYIAKTNIDNNDNIRDIYRYSDLTRIYQQGKARVYGISIGGGLFNKNVHMMTSEEYNYIAENDLFMFAWVEEDGYIGLFRPWFNNTQDNYYINGYVLIYRAINNMLIPASIDKTKDAFCYNNQIIVPKEDNNVLLTIGGYNPTGTILTLHGTNASTSTRYRKCNIDNSNALSRAIDKSIKPSHHEY